MKRFESINISKLNVCGIDIEGASIAGLGTSFTLPQFKICFDTAQGLPHAFHMKHYFITHCHMDHAGGIPYLISQKALNKEVGFKFYMPDMMIEPMTQIMHLWSSTEGYQYQFHFQSMKAFDSVDIDNQHFVKAFPTVHRVPSQGYTLFEKRHPLKPEFKNLTQNEIRNLKHTNVEVNTVVETPVFSFTGDTQIEFLEKSDWIKNSKILMMEITYCGTQKSVDAARLWGHTHLDEFLDVISTIKSEKIVLIHQSSRHSIEDVSKLLKNNLNPNDLERVLIFPRG